MWRLPLGLFVIIYKKGENPFFLDILLVIFDNELKEDENDLYSGQFIY